MDKKKLYLLKKIESCREEMINLSSTEELTSDAVISASVRLDYLINEYYRFEKLDYA